MYRATILLILTNCAPDMAEAIVVKGLGKGKVFSSGVPEICGNASCNSARGETCSNCSADCGACFTNTYCVNMDGTNDIISTAADAWSGNYTALTVSFWFKSSAAMSAGRFFMGKSAVREFEIRNGTTDTSIIRFAPGNSTANYCETDTGRVNTSWHHYFMVYDGSGTGNAGRCFIYVDGVNRTTTYAGTIGASITDSNGFLYINGTNGYASPVGGKYDEVAIWRSNKASIVSSVYNGGHPGSLSSYSPDRWYRMGDDAADVIQSAGGNLQDVSGNGQHMTVFNLFEGNEKTADVP